MLAAASGGDGDDMQGLEAALEAVDAGMEAAEAASAGGEPDGAADEEAAMALDMESLRQGLSELKLAKAEDEEKQFKAAFGSEAAITDGDSEDDDSDFEDLGVF